MPLCDRKAAVEVHGEFSVRRQCKLLGLARSSVYYEPVGESADNLELMRRIDEEYTEHPFYGSRRMAVVMDVGRKRVQRLMRVMDIAGAQPRRRTTVPAPRPHKIYPYLLREVVASYSNHIWSTDITYIPLRSGFVFLVAIMDWFSRYVLSWRVSNTIDTAFCVEALEEALEVYHEPDYFNTDQGSQFTSKAFLAPLEARDNIAISMDGRGRFVDNIWIERLWRSVKHEDVYMRLYETAREARLGLDRYFAFYNTQRPHQSLGYRTPATVYWEVKGMC
jgi:putative transposase